VHISVKFIFEHRLRQFVICEQVGPPHFFLQSEASVGGFLTITFLRGWIVSPAPNPQPGGPGLRIYDPRGQGDPATSPGTGYPF
jgi:hypothetical protein